MKMNPLPLGGGYQPKSFRRKKIERGREKEGR
jgi:hypothetical protein